MVFSVGSWVNAAISIISVPLITWYVSPSDFGKGALFTVAFNLVLNLVLLGLDQSYMRSYNDLEPHQKSELLLSVLGPSISFAVIIIIGLEVWRSQLATTLFEADANDMMIEALAGGILVGIMYKFLLLSIRMQQKAFYFSIVQVLSTAVSVVSTLIISMYWIPDYRAIVIGFIISQGFALLTCVVLDWKVVRGIGRANFNLSLVKRGLAYGLPFVPTFILDWIFQSSDRAMLRAFSTFENLGLYSTASKIASGLNVIQSGFNSFWSPFVFKKYTENENDFKFTGFVFEGLSVLFMLLILLIVLCKDFVSFIFPPSYKDSIGIFPLLLLNPMLFTLSEVTSIGINLKKETKLHLLVMVVTVTVNLSSSLLLIPRYGAFGAVLTATTSYFFLFVGRSYLSNRLITLPIRWWRFWGAFICLALTLLGDNLLESMLAKGIVVFGIGVVLLIYWGTLFELWRRILSYV